MTRTFIKIIFFTISIICCLSELNAQQPVPTSAKELQNAVLAHKQLFEESPLRNYPLRNIGPTNMSGRIVDIEVTSDLKTFYVAAASGGVWKTSDNGQSFTPIFDHQGALGMADLAIAPSDESIIWVGTGENNASRSTYAGNGVYKSTDGGKTWEHKGLTFSQHIGQIQIHPTDPNIVWVGSMGSLYSKNEERGLYKTKDGGNTWKKVLYIDNNTGVIDIKINPKNPDILLAASWERFREGHHFIGNGKGSAIWRSEDGGESWQKAMTGFPQDEFVGRIGFDFSRSNPEVVYALHDYQKTKEKTSAIPSTPAKDELVLASFEKLTVEEIGKLEDEKLNKFLRSNRFATKYDAQTLKRLVKQGKITPAQIANYNKSAKDANAAILGGEVVGAEVYKSTDAGKTWNKVNQSNLERLYNSYGYYFGEIRVGTQDENEMFLLGVPLLVSRDGGVNFSRADTIGDVHSDHQSMWINPNDGKHILLGTDGGIYRSYGGGARWTHLNDQLTISQFYSIMVDEAEPYRVYGGMQDNGVWSGQSTNKPEQVWNSLMGGDGMVVAVDTRNNDVIFTGFQFGNYFRIDQKKGTQKSVTPMHDIGREPNRWNWRTPATLSKHNQDILYMGSQYVYRSLDQGDTWETISQDLTKNKKNGNVPFATLTVIEESPLEFGTLYAGSDDGNLWVTKDHGNTWTSITKGLPADRWVSSVAPSQHKEGLVYVTLTGYRYDEFKPYIFKSSDYGKTWTPLVANLPAEAVNIIKEDHLHDNILYVGTDHGLYLSTNGGQQYTLVQGDLPNVAIYDMVIQKKQNDLVIGTHGRSVFIMNLNALHEMAQNKLPLTLLQTNDITLPQRRWSQESASSLTQEVLYYTADETKVKLELKNEKKETVSSWELTSNKGINKFSLPIKNDYVKGKYTLILTGGLNSDSKSFMIK
jgi:photosystem II stability/assembly factor-like uncharacterized protein